MRSLPRRPRGRIRRAIWTESLRMQSEHNWIRLRIQERLENLAIPTDTKTRVVFSNAQIPKIATAVAGAPPALPALPAVLPVSMNTLCREMGMVTTLTASQRGALGLSVRQWTQIKDSFIFVRRGSKTGEWRIIRGMCCQCASTWLQGMIPGFFDFFDIPSHRFSFWTRFVINYGFFIRLNNKIAMELGRALLYGTSVFAKNRNPANADVYSAE